MFFATSILLELSALLFEAAQLYELALFVCTLTFSFAPTALLFNASLFLKAAIEYLCNVWSRWDD